MKPLLIGEAPSKNEHCPRPLEGRVGRRLAKWCGLTFEEYLARFERVNLLQIRQDTREKGFEFDAAAAKTNAQLMIHVGMFDRDRTVILLGRRVAQAFGCGYGYFTRWFIAEASAYVVPHPSGVNRWFNVPENERRMQEFMRRICEDSKASNMRY